jgi:lysophospholipase L1-like esterase
MVGAPAVTIAVLVTAAVVTAALPGGAAATRDTATTTTTTTTTVPIFSYDGAQTPPPSAPAGRHPTRIVITGDSVALTLSFAIGKPKGLPPELVWDRSILGCPLFAGDRIADGVPTDGGPQCAAWRADRGHWLHEFRPQVVAVLSGVWDVYDRAVDGQVLTFASPEFDRWYARGLDALIAELSSTGARVALLTAPCNDRPDPNGAVLPENDPVRTEHLNELFRAAARRNPRRSALVDLNRFLCPGGAYVAARNGVTLRRDDGVHFSFDGAALTGKWLLPRLQKLADAR